MKNWQHTLGWILLLTSGVFLALTTMGASAPSGNYGLPTPSVAKQLCDFACQGQVLSVQSGKEDFAAYTVVRLKVEHNIKGCSVDTVELVIKNPGTYGWFPFQEGQTCIVFARRLYNGVLYTDAHMGNMICSDANQAFQLRLRIAEPERFSDTIDPSVYGLKPINHKLGMGLNNNGKLRTAG